MKKIFLFFLLIIFIFVALFLIKDEFTKKKFIEEYRSLRKSQYNNKTCYLEGNYYNELIGTHLPSRALKHSKDPQVIWVSTKNVYMLHDFHSSDMIFFQKDDKNPDSFVMGEYDQFIKVLDESKISFLYDNSKNTYIALNEDINIFVNKHVLAGNYNDEQGNKYTFGINGDYIENGKKVGVYDIGLDLMMLPKNNFGIEDYYQIKYKDKSKEDEIYYFTNKPDKIFVYSEVSSNEYDNSVSLSKEKVLSRIK